MRVITYSEMQKQLAGMYPVTIVMYRRESAYPSWPTTYRGRSWKGSCSSTGWQPGRSHRIQTPSTLLWVESKSTSGIGVGSAELAVRTGTSCRRPWSDAR